MKKIKLPFIKHNIAPYACSTIGIYNEQNELVGNIDISKIKHSYKTNKLYRFGVLSDVHQNIDDSADPGPDFENALSYFNTKESVKFTCICGDITEHSSTQELTYYSYYVTYYSPNTYVYTTTGNHDCNISDDNWSTYTCNLKTSYFDYNGDHFFFLGMNDWSLGPNGIPYLDTDITSLSYWLEEYKDDRCFVFTHLFFPDRAGNFKNTYPSGNWLGGEQLTRLEALNDKYKNVYWFSGHSHWKWYLQEHQRNANIYGKNCGWNVHIPSCASPIDSKPDKTKPTGWTRTSINNESEGAIIDVYEDYIEVRGVSFKQSNNSNYELKYIPCAQYILKPGAGDNDNYEDPVNIDFENIKYITADRFSKNAEKSSNTEEFPKVTMLNSGYYSDYVELRFNNTSQGFNVTPPNLNIDDSPSEAYLYVEDVIYYYAPNNDDNNLSKIDTPLSYVGFFGTTKYYGANQYAIKTDYVCSTSDADDQHSYSCALQTSSKYNKYNTEYQIGTGDNDYQLVILLKIKIGYNKSNE